MRMSTLACNMAGQIPNLSQVLPQFYQSSSTYDSSSVPSTASPHSPSSGPQRIPPLGVGLTSRPDITLHTVHPQQIPTSLSGTDSLSSRYGPDYSIDSGSTTRQDQFSVDRSGPGIAHMAHVQMSAGQLQAQKRAYRQRRKDPSCDACRERKVKVCSTSGNWLHLNPAHIESSVMQQTLRVVQSVQAAT